MPGDLEYQQQDPSGAEDMLTAIQDREKTYKEEDLSSDLNWLEASGKVYQMNNDGEKFQGDPKALAKYGIDQMSEFNFNVSLGTIPDVMKVEKADHDTQVAFAYMMDTYDKKDITLDGVGRALKETMTDPLTYVGISTLGAGFAAKKGVQYVAKEGFRNRLHAGIRNYLTSGLAVGATEGALYTAGDATARQSVYQDAGLMSEYDLGNIAASGAIGAVAGAGIAKGAQVVGKGIGKGIDYVRKQGEEAMAQVAGGGTPPKVDYKKLELINKTTAPKIPTSNIFLNEVSSEYPMKEKQELDSIELDKIPIESVKIKDIVPTQKNVTIKNLKGVSGVTQSDEPITAIKKNGKYFLVDGHHRVSNDILSGKDTIDIKVYTPKETK